MGFGCMGQHLKYSLTPKYDVDKVQFKFIDTIMKNEIIVRSLPAIELLLIIPSCYPSNQRPLIYTLSKFYEDEKTIQEFMIEELNQKWTEEMPCLYDMAMFI